MGGLLDWVTTTAGQYPLASGVVAAIAALTPFAWVNEWRRTR